MWVGACVRVCVCVCVSIWGVSGGYCVRLHARAPGSADLISVLCWPRFHFISMCALSHNITQCVCVCVCVCVCLCVCVSVRAAYIAYMLCVSVFQPHSIYNQTSSAE